MQRPLKVRGHGRVRPTFAVELLRARASLTVIQAVGLALREARRVAGASQRDYAAARGWSKTHQHRLETDAGSLRLGNVVEALEGTGCGLTITALHGQDPHAEPASESGRSVGPEDWADAEFIARDAAGRRFPAARAVRRARGAPMWWMFRHSTNALVREPEWTAAGFAAPRWDFPEASRTSVVGSSVDSMDPQQPSTGPTADRPVLPDGYGLPETSEGQLTWADVEPRLVQSLHYWISSVRPDGTPHSIPRWGVWLEGRFWYDGAPSTRHTRNVEVNPAVTLTLESGSQVVIIEGESVATRADADGLGGRLAQAYAKYADSGYAPGADSWSGEDGGGLRVITPRLAMAWFDFPKDCTRFRF